jgi:hemerythrin-like metal-binding protein
MNIFHQLLEAQRDWYKPEWFYQSIPWLYMGAGVFTISQLPNGIGIFSGGLLIMTSLIVLTQRCSYRRQRAQERAEKELEYRELKMLGTVVWRSSFNCGHKLMDEQHQALFHDANRIIDAVIDEEEGFDYDKTLLKLLRDTQRHIRDEDKFLNEMLPDIAPLHKETHQKLVDQIMSLVEDVRDGEATRYELLSFLVIDAITKHTLNEDLKWKELLETC